MKISEIEKFVLKEINYWDPEGLFPFVPIDEYLLEARYIIVKFNDSNIDTVEGLDKLIKETFVKFFSGGLYDGSFKVAKNIFEKLKEHRRETQNIEK